MKSKKTSARASTTDKSRKRARRTSSRPKDTPRKTSGLPPAESQALLSERRFRAFLQHSLDNISLLAADGALLWESPAVERTLGYAPDAFIGQKLFELVHPDDRELARSRLADLAMRSMATERDTLRLKHADNTWRWIEMVATNLLDEPSVNAIVINYRDITKRKRAEEALLRFRKVMDDSNDAVFLIDTKTSHYIDFNKTACECLRYTRSELAELGVIDVAQHITSMKVWHERSESIRNSGGLLFETQYKRKDGTIFPVEVSAKMLEDADNSVMLAIVRDITERKKVQEILLESEKYYRALIENSSDGVALGNAEGIVTYASASAARMLGYTIDEFVGHSGLEFIHPDDIARLQIALQDLLQKPGTSVTIEYRIKHKNGSWRWIEATVQNLLDEPAVHALVGNYRDITERRESQEALGESEERFRRIADTVPGVLYDYLVHKDGSTEFSFVGSRAKEILELEPKELMDDTALFFKMIHPDDLAGYLAADRAADDKPNEPFNAEVRMITGSGQVKWIHLTSRLGPQQPDGTRPWSGIMLDVTERRHAEQQLREAEERFRELSHHIEEAFWIADPELKKQLYLSPAAERIWGRAIPELEDWLGTVHPDDLAAVRAASEKQGRGEKTDIEYRIAHANGSTRWVWDRAFPVFDEHGKLTRIAGVTADITERKYAEKQLRDSEERFRELANNIEEVFWITDPQAQTELYVSPAAERIWGRPLSVFHQLTNFLDTILPADRAMVEAQLARQSRGEKTEMEYRIHRPDGSIRWIWDRAFPVLDSNGKLFRVAGISADVTERKQSEELLRLSEARYRAVVENQTEFVVRWKADGTRTFANEAYIKYFGLTPATANGSFLPLVAEEDRKQIEAKIARLRSGQVAIETETHRVVKPDGSIAWHEWTDQAIYDERGEVVEFQSVGRDVTKRTFAEQTIQERAADLERRVAERTAELTHANRAKDEFLANMSHELRTPLNSILGFSEALLEGVRGPLDEKQADAVEMIASSGKHLLGLINDILDVSKIEAGKFDVHPEVCMVDEICQSSLNFVRELANKKSITLEYIPAPGAANISADPRRLKQILVNILSNAVKFTPNDGRISLEVQPDPHSSQIHFSVTDTGIGISGDDLGELFRPFVQLDSSLSRQYEGSGLGLALVRKLVEMHGGEVHVSSDVGKGSRFTVTLPWDRTLEMPGVETQGGAIAREIARQAEGPARPTFNPKRGRILLVEDNETTVMVVRDYLEARGHEVTVANTGVEALERVNGSSPQIILMDIQMPEMDGLEAIRRLRADTRFSRVPIIAVTAFAMPGDQERFLAAGANDYLSKPVVLKSLREMVERYL